MARVNELNSKHGGLEFFLEVIVSTLVEIPDTKYLYSLLFNSILKSNAIKI